MRIKSPEKTERELDFFLENKVPQVKFVDRTFNCNHAYAYRIWKYIGEHDNGVTNFHFEIGGDLLHEEDFLLFDTFRPGLVQFEIGVQSTNPDTLKAIRRTADWDLLQKLPSTEKQVLLAGGLNPDNVGEALTACAGKIDGVDTSSGVERADGNGKSKERIEAFVRAVRGNK